MLIRADGAARGNPGRAAAGAVIIDASQRDAAHPDAEPLAVIARPLGIQTNNFAEYAAVILALEKALGMGAREAELVLDSQLVVEQLTGRWKVKHPALRPLVTQAQDLLSRLERWSIRHERRESNRAADALANLALDDPTAASHLERGVPAKPRQSAGPPGRAVVGAACAIFDARDRILLVRHAYGRLNWELPGGSALDGESPLAAAVRELREETALELEEGRLAGVYFESGHDFGPMVHFVFRFEPRPDVVPLAQPPEIDQVAWWPLSELPTPISDFTERRVRDALVDRATFAVIESRAWR